MRISALIYVLVIFFYTTVFAGEDTINDDNFGIYIGGGMGLYSDSIDLKNDIKHLEDLGVKFIRLNTDSWDLLEKKSGDYDFSKTDDLIELALKNKKEILFTLPISAKWNNTKTDKSKVPYTHYPAADFEDIGKLAYKLALRYKNNIRYWEVWNEPDYFHFWRGKVNAREYFHLLKVVSKAVRKANPEAQIVLGGLAKPDDLHFLQTLYKLGADKYFDILNIHLYYNDFDFIANILNKLNKFTTNNGGLKRVWVTEISTTPDYFGNNNINKEEAHKADFLLKSYVLLLSYGNIEKIFWHTLRNCGKDVGLSKDYDFGLISSDNRRLPAYYALLNFTKKVHGLKRPLLSYSKEGCIAEFIGENNNVIIAWANTSNDLIFDIPNNMKLKQILDINGRSVKKVFFNKNKYTITIKKKPLYIVLKTVT